MGSWASQVAHPMTDYLPAIYRKHGSSPPDFHSMQVSPGACMESEFSPSAPCYHSPECYSVPLTIVALIPPMMPTWLVFSLSKVCI